jgi:hypothetical protein
MAIVGARQNLPESKRGFCYQFIERGFPSPSYLLNNPHIISNKNIAAAESTLTKRLAKKYFI